MIFILHLSLTKRVLVFILTSLKKIWIGRYEEINLVYNRRLKIEDLPQNHRKTGMLYNACVIGAEIREGGDYLLFYREGNEGRCFAKKENKITHAKENKRI